MKASYPAGDLKQVAGKIIRHSNALGDINRFTFQTDNPLIGHKELMRSIELIGQEAISRIRAQINDLTSNVE